jgi:pantetheine-phosphate adenylyltransferase
LALLAHLALLASWRLSMTRIAVYPGTFDPITRGHEDLITRGLALADRVIVAVSTAGGKAPLFTIDERIELAKTCLGSDRPIEVKSFDGLLVDFAREIGASFIVRGLRYVSDFEYEYQMALMNRRLAPAIETVFLVPSFDLTYLSSSLVREVARFGGDVGDHVHPVVSRALRAKFSR